MLARITLCVNTLNDSEKSIVTIGHTGHVPLAGRFNPKRVFDHFCLYTSKAVGAEELRLRRGFQAAHIQSICQAHAQRLKLPTQNMLGLGHVTLRTVESPREGAVLALEAASSRRSPDALASTPRTPQAPLPAEPAQIFAAPPS